MVKISSVVTLCHAYIFKHVLKMFSKRPLTTSLLRRDAQWEFFFKEVALKVTIKGRLVHETKFN